jgi:hypothetical protein
MFCPTCGIDHHVAERAEEQAADRAVELARIEANRDITIAKITANVTRDTADVDQAAELARAEGKAEGMETAIDGAAVDQAPELGDGEPIVVSAPDAEPELEPEPELAPPPAPPSSPSSPSSSAGWWAGYR